jgi:tungstate transport system permease protein
MDYILEGIRRAIILLLAGDPETYSAVAATAKVSAMSMTVSLVLGIPLGFALGYAAFPGRRPLRFVMETLMALPTVLVGLLVYSFITRRGPLGNLGLLFTLPGVAIGQAILAVPIISSLTAAAVEGLDPRLRQTLLTLGANRLQLALGSFHEARYQIMLAAMNGFGRVTTEVGISMMLGGNIKWETRTITTAITLETGKGEFALGIALGLVLLFIAFLVNAGLALLRRRAAL